VNRYVSVCWPYRASELCSIRSAKLHVAAVALFAIVFNLPRYFEYKIVRESAEVGSDVAVGYRNLTANSRGVSPIPAAGITLDWNSTYSDTSDVGGLDLTSSRMLELSYSWLGNHPVYRLVYNNLLYFLVLFLFPFISLTFLNQRLIVELRRTRKRRARMRGGGGRRLGGADSARSEEDITLMLIVVVIVFVVTQTPAAVTQMLASTLNLRHHVCPSPFFFYERISDLLVVTNSSVNFVIYCLCSRRFRAALINLICRQQTPPNRLVTVANDKPSPDERREIVIPKSLEPLNSKLQPVTAEPFLCSGQKRNQSCEVERQGYEEEDPP